ncbi:MAG: penicillin-binding protein activator LpoB, partial [Kiritimatiellaeota bacterium]|nr:penicillin-binding protein activator LpoB [Kiritimatiellota bacterium]
MKTMMYVTMAALTGAVMTGCVTEYGGRGAREVTLDRKPMTYKLEPQDIRRTITTMVESMQQEISAMDLSEYGYTIGSKPVLDIDDLKNNTTLHLDMKSFTDSLRTALSKTRMFRFVSRSNAVEDITRGNEDALGGLVDPTKAI